MTEIPTRKVQEKIAEVLHKMEGCEPNPWETCTRRDDYMRKASYLLAMIMPAISTEMFPAVRDDERDKVAYYITAELVCCDIFQRMEAAGRLDDSKGVSARDPEGEWFKLRHGPNYHPMCRYGGWAASLAKQGPRLDTRPSEPWPTCPPPSPVTE